MFATDYDQRSQKVFIIAGGFRAEVVMAHAATAEHYNKQSEALRTAATTLSDRSEIARRFVQTILSDFRNPSSPDQELRPAPEILDATVKNIMGLVSDLVRGTITSKFDSQSPHDKVDVLMGKYNSVPEFKEAVDDLKGHFLPAGLPRIALKDVDNWIVRSILSVLADVLVGDFGVREFRSALRRQDSIQLNS